MKIGILTLPLHTNYGGNIQAYALMTVLRRMGHEVWLINRNKNKVSTAEYLKGLAKRSVQRFLLGRKDVIVFLDERRKREYPIISSNTQRFIETYIIPRTEPLYSTDDLTKCMKEHEFDALVVGSDQVWRPRYTPNIKNYFFNFIDSDMNCRMVSYAASFGTSEWEYGDKFFEECKLLLNRFHAVSVREDSAVDLCKSKFGVVAQHVLDPTMLLSPEDYVDLCREEFHLIAKESELLVYILDINFDKQSVIDKIANHFAYKPFSVNNNTTDKKAPVEERIYPPMERWLAGFANAKYVITDSFHACVFSIIFNKPFIVYANAQRGASRFESLLKMFGLQDRMILSKDMLKEEMLNSNIDWESVNRKLEYQKTLSIGFLKNALLVND